MSKRLPEVDLPAEHPATIDGRGPAYQCDVCHGIWYPAHDEPLACPYCAEDDE